MIRFVIAASLLATPLPASAAIFADSLVSQSNTTSFGSGLVTGAPDSGGLFLGSTFDPPALLGEIVVGFSTALANGAGADLRIYDVASSSNETFDVFVSSDNISYTLIGGFSATNNLVDFDGLFAGPVSFVRLANNTRLVSVDIDAVEGFFAASAVPEPSSWALMLAGFGLIGFTIRRRAPAVGVSFV